MQSLQIIAGFTDIKSELRTKTQNHRPDLRLWFSMQDGVLYTHDYDNHDCCIVLAIKLDGEWKVKLSLKNRGIPLLNYVIKNYKNIINALHNLYKTHGTQR